MPQPDKAFSVALAVFLHLAGLSSFALLQWRLLATEERVAPELDAASMDLSLMTLSNESPGEPSSGDSSGQAAATVPSEALPAAALDIPQPSEPVPLPALPEKPSFTDTLPPPPEPPPVPDAAPAPKPVAPPVPSAVPELASPSAAAAVAPAAVASARPLGTTPSEEAGVAAKGSGGEGPPSLQPGGGGGYGRVDAHPSLMRSIKPNYPIGARRRGEEGTVVLDVTVSVEGQATSVSLVSSCGFSELDAAAERAVLQARFKPGKSNGRAVESSARLTIIFRLRDQ